MDKCAPTCQLWQQDDKFLNFFIRSIFVWSSAAAFVVAVVVADAIVLVAAIFIDADANVATTAIALIVADTKEFAVDVVTLAVAAATIVSLLLLLLLLLPKLLHP